MAYRDLNEQNCALMLAKARNDAGKSQRFMATAMGKSIGTIQNWEAGIGTPNMLDAIKWFEVLGLKPMRYFLDFLYPYQYQHVKPSGDIDALKTALVHYIDNVATDEEIRKLSYLIYGATGSTWTAQLDMLTAHSHVTLKARVATAMNIYMVYLLEKSKGELVSPDCILPDENYLRKAIEKGFQSLLEGKDGYVNLTE